MPEFTEDMRNRLKEKHRPLQAEKNRPEQEDYCLCGDALPCDEAPDIAAALAELDRRGERIAELEKAREK